MSLLTRLQALIAAQGAYAKETRRRANTECLCVGGRVYAYSNGRWVAPGNTNGLIEPNWNNNLGTAAEPNVEWNIVGQPIEAGTVIRRIKMFYAPNNAAVTALRLRLDLHRGDFAGTWDSNAETTVDSIVSDDAVPVAGTDNKVVEYTPDFTLSADGFFIPKYQPSVTGTTTRYIAVSMLIEVEHPN